MPSVSKLTWQTNTSIHLVFLNGEICDWRRREDSFKSQCSDFGFEDIFIIAIYIIFDCRESAQY